MAKTDAELLGNIEEVRKKFVLLGFKGSLAEFLAELVRSKQNKLDKVVFSGDHFTGLGTKEDPVKVKFPETGGGSNPTPIPDELIKRIEKLESYINTLDNF